MKARVERTSSLIEEDEFGPRYYWKVVWRGVVLGVFPEWNTALQVAVLTTVVRSKNAR